MCDSKTFMRGISIAFVLFTPILLLGQFGPITIDFDEDDFPNSDLVLVSPGMTTYTDTYDVVTDEGPGLNGSTIYSLGDDGTDDLSLTVTLVTSANNPWTQTEGDWDDASNGSFRSDWSIANNQSRPNDWAYVKFDIVFINGLENSVTASEFETVATSMNGSSEGYEWSQITINGTTIGEALIGNYTNLDYSDLSGSTYFDASGVVIDPGAASNTVLPNNITMSEFLSGSASGAIAPGGLVETGWWAVDDFNTSILDGPEAATINPGAGNGSVNDDQTLVGADFGFTDNQLVDQVTYYFGLTDVAFDTDGDGFTKTNSLPAAGWTSITLGYPVNLPIELSGFNAKNINDEIELFWETKSEINNSHFIIERSADGQSFEDIGQVQGSLNSNSTNYYDFIDRQPPSRLAFYRLHQVDLDGRSSYSKVISVKVTEKNDSVILYPSITSDKLILEFNDFNDSYLEIQIIDMYGHMVNQQQLNTATHSFDVDVSTLPKGHYVIKVLENSMSYSLRFVKI